MSLTRASTATYTDSGGATATAAIDAPRYDHDTSGVFRGLLAEVAATNVALNSQDLTQTSWTKAASTATAGTLTESNTSAIHNANTGTTLSLTSGQPVCSSCIASEHVGSAKRYLTISMAATGFAAAPVATFDLAAGTLTTANCTAAMEAAPGGWLCSMLATPNATVTTARAAFGLSSTSTAVIAAYLGDASSGVNVSEMQIETRAGLTGPSSRIRTTSAAVTRSADAVTIATGLADGGAALTLTLDDLSTQTLSVTVSSGNVTVPVASLSRPRILSYSTTGGGLMVSVQPTATAIEQKTHPMSLSALAAVTAGRVLSSARVLRASTSPLAIVARGVVHGASLSVAAAGSLVRSSLMLLTAQRLWTPLDCATLALWFSADDLPAGLVVTAPSGQPTLDSIGVNGHPGVTFDGSAMWLDGPDVTGILPLGADPGTHVGVLSQNAPQAVSSPIAYNQFGYGGDGAVHGSRTIRVGTNPTTQQHLILHDGTDNLADANLASGALVVSAHFEGQTAYGWLNGAPFSPASAPMAFSSAGQRFRISGRVAIAVPVDQFALSSMRHIFLGTMSDADRQRLEGWGAWDAGIASQLPSDHPYRNSPPMVPGTTVLASSRRASTRSALQTTSPAGSLSRVPSIIRSRSVSVIASAGRMSTVARQIVVSPVASAVRSTAHVLRASVTTVASRVSSATRSLTATAGGVASRVLSVVLQRASQTAPTASTVRAGARAASATTAPLAVVRRATASSRAASAVVQATASRLTPRILAALTAPVSAFAMLRVKIQLLPTQTSPSASSSVSTIKPLQATAIVQASQGHVMQRTLQAFSSVLAFLGIRPHHLPPPSNRITILLESREIDIDLPSRDVDITT
jgi:hypothetical protein